MAMIVLSSTAPRMVGMLIEEEIEAAWRKRQSGNLGEALVSEGGACVDFDQRDRLPPVGAGSSSATLAVLRDYDARFGSGTPPKA